MKSRTSPRINLHGCVLLLCISTGLLSGCLGIPLGEVEKHWGEAYAKTMRAQIENAAPDPAEKTSYSTELGEVDALTSDLILENYQTDVKRTPAEERETFVIDTGLN
jgi:hypothetical protein